jgi:hypothetical protein
MLRISRLPVKSPLASSHYLQRHRRIAQTASMPSPTLLVLLAGAALISLGVGLYTQRRARLRQRTIARVLDAADALERGLRAARSELETVTSDGQDPVRGAMRELLRHRLWLQEHGQTASLDALEQLRASLDGARRRIDEQLGHVARARADAAQAEANR